MKKVVEIKYLETYERGAYSRGIVLVLEDGRTVELMTTDIIADDVKEPNPPQGAQSE